MRTKPESNSWSAYFPPGFETLYLDMGFGKRWQHFTFDELACKGTGSLLVHYETLDKLEYLRRLYGGPIHVNSYYRDPAYNKQVRGAEESYHLLGRAIDTPLLNGNMAGRMKLVHLATLAGFRGFGLYPNFTHIDTGYTRFWSDTNYIATY